MQTLFLHSVLQHLPLISLEIKVSCYAGVKVQWEGCGQTGKGDDILKCFIKHQMLQNQRSGTMYLQLSKEESCLSAFLKTHGILLSHLVVVFLCVKNIANALIDLIFKRHARQGNRLMWFSICSCYTL